MCMCTAAAAVTCFNPVITGTALITYLFYMAFSGRIRTAAGSLAAVPFFAVINFLFQHTGKTVIFMLGRTRFTLESLVYGAILGALLASALLIFHFMNACISFDGLSRLIGRVFPVFGLMTGMTLYSINRTGKKYREISDIQKNLGVYPSGSLKNRLSCSGSLFSALIDKSFEDSLTSAQSMRMRGFDSRTEGRTKRDRRDWVSLIFPVILTGLIVLYITGSIKTDIYSGITIPEFTPAGIAGYAVFLLLCLLPAAIYLTEELRWKR